MWPKNPYTELFRFWIFLQIHGSFLVCHEYSARHPSIALYKAISGFHYYSTNCTSVQYRKRKNKRTLDVYTSITWRLKQHENIQLWVQQWQRNNQAFMSYNWFLLPYFNGLALELAWYSGIERLNTMDWSPCLTQQQTQLSTKFPCKTLGNPSLQLKLGLCTTHFTIHIVCRLYTKQQAYTKFDSTAGKNQEPYI